MGERSNSASEHPRGPPWILGARGTPLETPENTLISCARALELGLDGFSADVRASASNDLVLHADATLERTTDGTGPIGERTWRELAELDAGGWFGARFRGTGLALLDEVLALAHARGDVRIVLALHERGLASVIERRVRELAPRVSVRAVVDSQALALEARDAGLVPILAVRELDEHLRARVDEERIAAIAAPVRAWLGALGGRDWPVERWSLDVDEPEDLLSAARAPIHALTTREPARARAARELARMAPGDAGPWPVQVPELEVHPDGGAQRGEWWGSWDFEAHVRNPFAFPVRSACELVARRGAFEVVGLPIAFDLAAGEERALAIGLTGGSWRVGGDPLVTVRMSWRRGPGRAAGDIVFDAPLARVRSLRAHDHAQRLVLLRESPLDLQASVTLKRHRRWLLVAIENPGGLSDARIAVHLDGREHLGGRGLRLAIPEQLDTVGVRFSCGIIGRTRGERIVRRWAGGLLAADAAGRAGMLLPPKPA